MRSGQAFRSLAGRLGLRAFAGSQSALAAVEFATVMPFLVLFMLAGAETTRYVNTTRQLTNLANSMATLIAERTTNMQYNDAIFAFNSAMVTFPQVLKDSNQKGVLWQLDIAVTLSSIVFSPTVSGCTSGCTYKAAVSWSAGSPTAGTRSCSVPPTAVADTAAPSLTTLPQDLFQAGSLIAVDVAYAYAPVFGSKFVPALTLRRSVYLQPRYLSSIALVGVSC